MLVDWDWRFYKAPKMLVYGVQMKNVSFLFSVLLSINSFAGLSEDYHALKNAGKDLTAIGSICEDVTQLRYIEKYPEPQFRVLTGIAYSDKDRTIGELDLIVFDNETHNAILIGEVKCWKDPKSGLKKAKEQRQRFLDYVRSSKALTFKWLTDPKEKFTKTQFNKTSDFISIAQLGAKSKGFDVELEYTLDELMKLREDIMQCQNSGECLKPH
jgi:hypothetical protein